MPRSPSRSSARRRSACTCSCSGSSTRAPSSACSGRRTTSRPAARSRHRSTCRPAAAGRSRSRRASTAPGALFLALLTVRKSPSRAGTLPHLAMAGIGLAGVILGFGRGVFAAVAIVLARSARRVARGPPRRALRPAARAAVPDPDRGDRRAHRAGSDLVVPAPRSRRPPAQDANVIWRERANAAVLAQVREQPIVRRRLRRGSSTFFFNVKSSNGFLVPFRQDIGQDPHDGYPLPARGRRDSRARLVPRPARRVRVRRVCVATGEATTDTETAADRLGRRDALRLPLRGGLRDDVRVPERPAADLGAARRCPRSCRCGRSGNRRLAAGGLASLAKPLRILAVSMSARPHGIGGMEDHLHTLTEELARRGPRGQRDHRAAIRTASRTRRSTACVGRTSTASRIGSTRRGPSSSTALFAPQLGERHFDVRAQPIVERAAARSGGRPPGLPPIVLSLHGNYVSIVEAAVRSRVDARRTPRSLARARTFDRPGLAAALQQGQLAALPRLRGLGAVELADPSVQVVSSSAPRPRPRRAKRRRHARLSPARPRPTRARALGIPPGRAGRALRRPPRPRQRPPGRDRGARRSSRIARTPS